MPPLDDSVAQVLSAVFADPARSAGLVLEEVSVTSAGRRRVVRVVVDRAGDEPGDVDLDAVSVVSAAVSEALDASPVLGAAPYTLEVSSPGVDRPLLTPRHWSRSRGRLVLAVLTDGTVLRARVESVDEAGVGLRLEPEGVKGRPPRGADVGAYREVAWAELVRGEVQVEFRRTDGDAVHDDALDDDELDDDELGREDEQ